MRITPRRMNRWVGLISALSVTLVAGCYAFRNAATWTLDEREIRGGGTIHLNKRVENGVGPTYRTLELYLIHDTSIVSYEVRISDEQSTEDGGYELRVDAETLRVSVLARNTGKPVLSADFSERKCWRNRDEQPKWAPPDEEGRQPEG